MSKIIGVDLGTTYSVCAFVEEGQPKVIPSSEGRNLVPSIVEPQKRLAGDAAKEQQAANYQNTIFSVKRLMGRRFKDESVQQNIEYLPFVTKEGQDGGVVVEIGGKAYTPQEISAMILQKIKRDAESFLGERVTEAVITVPAYFDDGQRQATKQAGEIAGFKVRRIINEPTAASLAYGLGKKKGEKIVVYDLGGGTFDVSILEMGEGIFEVRAVAGDTNLGGDDFDQRIVDFLLKESKLKRVSSSVLQCLRVVAERAKVELTSSFETEIFVPLPTRRIRDLKPFGFRRQITRTELEQLTSDLIEKTLTFVRQALSDAELSPQDIDEVVLAGGMTRMPAVREGVKRYFGKDPHTGVNPDEVVAVGAAIQGAILAGEMGKMTLIDITPLSLGLETLGGLTTRLIKRNTPIPTSTSQIFSTAADDQALVEIHVLQGEREMAADCKSLGRFKLDGIPPAPRAVPRIEVAFKIDSNGILHVSAQDLATGSKQKVTVIGSTGLSKEEVGRVIKEGESYAEEDREKRERIVAVNSAADLIYAAEQLLKEKRGGVPQNIRREVNREIKELRALLKSVSSRPSQGRPALTKKLRQKTADLSGVLRWDSPNLERKRNKRQLFNK